MNCSLPFQVLNSIQITSCRSARTHNDQQEGFRRNLAPASLNAEWYIFQLNRCGMHLLVNVPLQPVMTDTIMIHKIWLSKPEHRGGIMAYHPKISGFEKYLKRHIARKSAAVVAVGRVPPCVETYFVEKLLGIWADHARKYCISQ